MSGTVVVLAIGVFLAPAVFCQEPNVPPADVPPEIPPVVVPDFPNVALQLVASGLQRPTAIAHAGDNSGRLFVAEQNGTIRILRNGAMAAEPFLDLGDRSTRIRSRCCDERGLLGLAFPRSFPAKGQFYVFYTEAESNSVVIARFTVSEDPNRADPDSEKVLLKIPHEYENHFGGHLAFSPTDGKLYLSLGDGAGGGDPLTSAQDPAAPYGKILRMDVEKEDEPPEVVASGLRNPWRFSFDRGTGEIYVGDVGEDLFEEINLLPVHASGWNFGWSYLEGGQCVQSFPCPWDLTVFPVVAYDHSEGCSVTGGYVYRGNAFPAMNGIYFFADFCRGALWGLVWSDGVWHTVKYWDENGMNISTFGEDQAGEVYAADFVKGEIHRLVADPAAPAGERTQVRRIVPTHSMAPRPARRQR